MVRHLAMAAAVALGAVASVRGAESALRYKFKQGEDLHYVMDQKMAMKMNVAGNDMNMDMNQTIDVLWHVVSVDADGKAKMTQKFDRIRFSMEGGPIGKVSYDSKDGKGGDEGGIGGMITPIFKAMAGAEMTVTMDPAGKVSDVKIPDKMKEAIQNSGGAQGMGQMFSDENLKKMTGAGGVILPEGPLTKGKTWQQTVEMKMPFGAMKVVSDYTDEGQAERGGSTVEQIGIKSKMTMDEGKEPNTGMTIKLKDQSGKGHAYFDAKAGRLVESTLDQTMKMEMNMGGQEMTQTMVQKVSFKLQGK